MGPSGERRLGRPFWTMGEVSPSFSLAALRLARVRYERGVRHEASIDRVE